MVANKTDQVHMWLLLAWWIVASFASWLAGMALGVGVTLVARLVPGVNEDRFLSYAVLLSLGLTVGIAQSVALKPNLHKAARWIPATFSGHALALLVFIGANLIQSH